MAMAAELACCKTPGSCAPWDAAGTKLRMPAAGARRLNVATRRVVCLPVRAAGEDVGTTEEKLQQSTTPYKAGSQQKKWTGYVEKDTAGQTNIYAVEPDVYVSETPFSSGEKGASSSTKSSSSLVLTILAGFTVFAIAGAASVLLGGQSAPTTPEMAVGYSGPPLSYYVAKFSTQATAAATEAVAEAPEVSNVEVSN